MVARGEAGGFAVQPVPGDMRVLADDLAHEQLTRHVFGLGGPSPSDGEQCAIGGTKVVLAVLEERPPARLLEAPAI